MIQFAVPRGQLREAVTGISRVITSRSTLPVLG